MIINNYTIEVTLNNSEARDLDPREVSFSLRDSIFSLYPVGNFSIQDPTGYFLESRAFTEGVPFSITFGLDGENLTNHYCIHSMENSEPIRPTQLGGAIDFSLIHEAFRHQARPSEAYLAVPSDIITDIFPAIFEDTEIESTQKVFDKPLYRARLNQEDFIHQILLPNSISSVSNPSPYYCFIDSRNILHFESYLQMIGKSPITTLFTNDQNKVPRYYQKTFSFAPFTYNMVKHKKFVDISLEYISDEEEPQEKQEMKSLLDFSLTPYPLFQQEEEHMPFFEGVMKEESVERSEAHIHYLQRYAMNPDKIIVTTPLYTPFCAGTMVSVDTEYEGGNLSYSYSGDYLIEQSDHVWDGEGQSGYSQFVLGKMNPSYPSGSQLERGLRE